MENKGQFFNHSFLTYKQNKKIILCWNISSDCCGFFVACPVKHLSAGQQRSHKGEAKWFLSSVSLLFTKVFLAQWRHDGSLKLATDWEMIVRHPCVDSWLSRLVDVWYGGCLVWWMSGVQGPTGRGFQLRDGSGSGIGKNISGRIGYGLGTGICIGYSINRVLSGSENLDRVFFGYLCTSYLSHGTWLFPVGPYADDCWLSLMVQHD